jgi:hypothetical protein
MKKIALSATLLLLCCVSVLAQNLSPERSQELEMLRGIDAARVEVKSEIKQRGVQASALQETVEAKLKRAGIKVLEPDEHSRVIVSVSLTRGRNNSVVIRVQLQQIATLNRLDKIIFAPTWERLTVGTSVRQDILLSVSKLVDQLMADYVSVNRQVTRLSIPARQCHQLPPV